MKKTGKSWWNRVSHVDFLKQNLIIFGFPKRKYLGDWGWMRWLDHHLMGLTFEGGMGILSPKYNSELSREWKSRWWFQILFLFTPIWGRFPFWRAYFWDGLKPPTRWPLKKVCVFSFYRWSSFWCPEILRHASILFPRYVDVYLPSYVQPSLICMRDTLGVLRSNKRSSKHFSQSIPGFSIPIRIGEKFWKIDTDFADDDQNQGS